MAVRLVVNADGSGQVMSAVSFRAEKEVKRAQNSVSTVDVNKLLQLIDKAGFWSMASVESTEQKTDAAGRKVMVFDGAWWMLEAVQNGSYHYVYRQNPEPGSFTEVGCYLANDLAKRDDSAISLTRCGFPHP